MEFRNLSVKLKQFFYTGYKLKRSARIDFQRLFFPYLGLFLSNCSIKY